jgi:polyphosphate:AMP phosphotransferase
MRAYDEIEWFERQLTSGGYLLIKLFLHISQKEQKKRYVKLESNPSTAWRITKRDWIHHKKYTAYGKAAEEALGKSSSPHAPWHIIAAENRRFATVKMFETACEALEKALDAKSSVAGKPVVNSQTIERTRPNPLDNVDLTKTISPVDYGKRLTRYQAQMRNLEHEIYVKRIPVVIVYEGWDAAGKGGNIKRLTQSMDPRGYEVTAIGAPNDIEKRHHYLWRFWKAMPKGGHVGIFDRSWYGRVLVERVEGLCSEAEWRRAYREINEMEMQLVDFGAILVKFWLHIDREEQLRRFEERKVKAHKKWKITDEDWRNRERWNEYYAALGDMLDRTSTSYAPWTVVESNSKHYARLKALRTVIKAIKKRL